MVPLTHEVMLPGRLLAVKIPSCYPEALAPLKHDRFVGDSGHGADIPSLPSRARERTRLRGSALRAKAEPVAPTE
jgi:hypothetical protein